MSRQGNSGSEWSGASLRQNYLRVLVGWECKHCGEKNMFWNNTCTECSRKKETHSCKPESEAVSSTTSRERK